MAPRRETRNALGELVEATDALKATVVHYHDAWGRLEQVAGSKYAYDANGNVTSGGGRRIGYTSYDLPTSIVQGSTASEFVYGPDRERLVRRDKSDGKLRRKTWHLSGVERIESADGSVEVKRYLAGGALETVAYDVDGEETGRRLDYLLTDHLGSVVAIVERTATPSGQYRWDVREERAFDPWGGCRDPATWKACGTKDVLPKDNGLTRRGFTGHETLAAIGLVHMNGRIYDPALGRFLQADPYVQSGSDLQGLNRYAYVLNNPLSAVDPSGYIAEWLGQALVRFVIASVVQTIGHELFNGGSGAGFAGALRGGMIAGASPWGFTSASGAWRTSPPFTGPLNRGVVMSLQNCMGGTLQNGRYGHWFPSAGTGGFFGGPLGSWIGFTLGDRSASIMQFVLMFASDTLQSGRKFANSAASTAFNVAIWIVPVGAVGAVGNAVYKIYTSRKATKEYSTVIGRAKDLQNLRKGERSLLDRLPNQGTPKANWKQNSGVLRQAMGKGKPIRDASPGDNRGQFLNAERNPLKERGWTYDEKTKYWYPPNYW